MADLKHTDVGASLSEAEYDGNAAHYSGAIGDLLYASTATVLSGLADVAVGSVLISGGVGVAPSWSATPAVTGITVGATGVITASGDLILNPSGNNVTIGAKSLKFTDILLKEEAYDMLAIRNAADTAYRGLVMGDQGLWTGGSVYFLASGKLIAGNSIDGQSIIFKIQDTGVGEIEVARLQGAADPYFQFSHLRLLPIATASLPATPVEGMFYYDDTANKLKVYNGAAWETVTSAV